MWDEIRESNMSRRGVKDGFLIEECCEFLRLVTLNSQGLISQLKRMEITFNNLEVEFLLNESGQISQPMYMNHLNI